MKIVLIILLVLVIMLIAFGLSEQYADKFDLYNNLKMFLNQFKLNLNFKQDKILDFLNKVKSKKQFKIFITAFENYVKTGVVDLHELKVVDSEEINELTDIIQNVGKLDLSSENKQLEMFIERVDIRLNKAKEDKQKLCPMIIKLSLLFAIGLAILLI